MQQDEDVGKISQATPMLIANAMEQFVGNLCSGTAAIAAERGSKTISASHLKACIQGSELLDFLKDVVKDVPDLPPEDQPKVKKQRSSCDGEPDAAGTASRGRGRRGRPPGSGRGRASGCPPGGGRGRGSRGGRTSRPKAVEDDVEVDDLEDGDGLQAGDRQQGQGPPAGLDQSTSQAAAIGGLGSEPGGPASSAAVPLQQEAAASGAYQGAPSGFAFQAGPSAAEDEDDYDEEDED